MNYLNLLFTLWNIFVYSFLNGHEAHRKSEELYNLLNILSKTNKCCLIENAPKNCTYKKLVYSDLVYIKISIYCIAPTSEETYIAQYYPITHDMRYLVNFDILGGKNTHHVLVYLCNYPYKHVTFWYGQTVCKDPPNILWAMSPSANNSFLPKDTGFDLYKQNKKYFVIQFHELEIKKNINNAVIIFTFCRSRPKLILNILSLLANNFELQPNSYPQTGCTYKLMNNKVKDKFVPVLFRIHAHKHATSISLYLYNGSWHLIGKDNPNKNKKFNNVKSHLELKEGDRIYLQCRYNTINYTKPINIGFKSTDEMCNGYIIYYSNYNNQISGYMKFDIDKTLPEYSDHIFDRKNFMEVEKVTLDKWPLGNNIDLLNNPISGVANDLKDNVYIFNRKNYDWNSSLHNTPNKFIKSDTIYKFDKNGHFIDSYGKNIFMMPHGIHVDALDRIWTTDVKLNRIVCLNPNSKQIILILGKSFKRKNERSQFCQPSDVLTIHDGKYLFVADGYCNSRIVMFDDSGNYMKEFTVNEQMTDGLKNVIIHGLSFIPDTYSICAVLRLNAKIVCFNIMNDSITFMYQFKRDIQLFAIAYTKIENKSGFYMIGMNNDDGIGYGYSLNLINKAIFAWDDIILNNPHDLIISNDKCFLYISSIGEMKNLQRLKLCKLGDTDTDPILANNSEYYVNILINFTIVFAVLFVLAPITYIFTLCFDKYKSKCQNSKVKSLFKSWRKCLQGKEYKKTDSDKLTLLNN